MWDVNLNFQEKLQHPTPIHHQLTDDRISFHYHEQTIETLMFQAFCWNSFILIPASYRKVVFLDPDEN
jgi:hypothetical protein